MGSGHSRTVGMGNTSVSFATAGRAAGEPMIIPTGEDTSANGGMGISTALEFRTYPDGRKEDGEWSGGEFIKGAEENSPLSDTSKKPPAAIVDASEINQSRPVVLIGNESFGGLVPLLMVFLVFGVAIAAVFGLKTAAPSIAVRGQVGEADEQSKIVEARRALLEAVEDFSVSDAKLLELRASARRLSRNSRAWKAMR